jgi:hypothetical protein
MRYRFDLPACLALLTIVACGEGSVAPSGGSGDELASRFEQLADSVDGEGYSPTAEALRHAAEIVRLAGGATPVTLTIDGQSRAFVAVAEQLDFPRIECTWPGGDGGTPVDSVATGPLPEPGPPGEPPECEEVGVYSMRTLIAWEPEEMAEVVRIVADPGNTAVAGVPDVMTGLPAGSAGGDDGEVPPSPGDSALSGPGFIGEYLERDVGNWWAVEGTGSNSLESSSGACTEDETTFQWARFSCRGARYRFDFDMRVARMSYDPATGWKPGEAGPHDPPETREIALASTEIAGVRLEVIEWAPPPIPPVDPAPPPPPPVDSSGVSPGGTT